MPKKIIYPIAFILLSAVVFSLLDYRGEYLAERKLYFTDKAFTSILKGPEFIPPAFYAQTAAQYKDIITKYAKTVSSKKARLLLGGLYVSKKEFAAARGEFNDILKKFPEDKNYCAEALFAIGNSYEAEAKWAEALSTYESIMDNYIGTTRALNTPLHIANYYKRKDDDASKNNYLLKAAGYYKKIAQTYPNSQLGYIALNYEIASFQLLEKWGAVLEMLKNILFDYPNAPDIIRNLRRIEMIAIQRLKAPQRAIDIFEDFIKQYPEHRLNNILQKQIKLLRDRAAKMEERQKNVGKTAQQ